MIDVTPRDVREHTPREVPCIDAWMQRARQHLRLMERSLRGGEPAGDNTIERKHRVQQLVEERPGGAVFCSRRKMRFGSGTQFSFEHFGASLMRHVPGVAVQFCA